VRKIQLSRNVPTRDKIMRSFLQQLSFSNSDLPIREPVAKTYREKKEEAEENGCEPARLSTMEYVELIVNLLENIDALDECDPARIANCIG
jgi:hypothetical protein